METVSSIKGFDANLRCRGYQFELGATYEHAGTVEACSSGFHGVEGCPLEVFNYYPPGESRYTTAEQSGALSRQGNDSKIASAKISIGVELRIADLVERAVTWVMAQCPPSETQNATGGQSAASSTENRSVASSAGDRSAASSTGDQSAASSTGYQSAASSTGYQSAASSAGDRSVASSAGDRSAASSTGYQSAASSTGDQSAAMSSGENGRVMGADGCALFLVYRDENTSDILHAWAGIAGRAGIKPLVWYSLNASGQPVEVGAPE